MEQNTHRTILRARRRGRKPAGNSPVNAASGSTSPKVVTKRRGDDDEHEGASSLKRSKIEETRRELEKLQIDCTSFRQKWEEEQRKRQEAEMKCENFQQKFLDEKKAKDDALMRLSSLASSKLRDNNPNIADLSDQNRPTKIAEKMSELYDNEWTDAYDDLEKNSSGTDIISILLGVLKDTFDECRKLAVDNFFERIEKAIKYPILEESDTPVACELPNEVKQQIKEYRKLKSPKYMDRIKNILKNKVTLPSNSEDVQKYFRECVEVCWLAAVQDPPLHMRFKVINRKFNSEIFRDYIARGPFMDFMVWPPLFLKENGPLLSKGVAQGCKKLQ
ncbi:uncharacterized protein LOC128227501 [Mya arenaria]|uniref:uncharacterized protein LOC128227501 n=1 Tax=Mya arenaria TaxID=6604 RepID=UPI0022E7CDEB|nr:uncharacterized protein LOC128227501 [Mya arenaria]XP_052794076.1 uncharacterized protein LOC128227501 [Mya arenaria]